MANELTAQTIAQLAFVPFPEGLDQEQVGDWLAKKQEEDEVIMMGNGLVVPRSNLKYTVKLMEKCAKFFAD